MIRILPRFVVLPLAVMSMTAAALAGQQYPARAMDGVADMAGIIDPADEERLRGRISMLAADPGVEVAVLTVRSIADFRTNDRTPEAFATAVYNQWRLGRGYPQDGVLVLVAVDDRFARIEVGDGVPAPLQARMQGIMDGWMVPRFRRGEYGGGVTDGLREIEKAFRGASAEAAPAPEPAYRAPAAERERGGISRAAVLAIGAALALAGLYAARGWRGQPRQNDRPCPTCRRPMELLGETADDAFLNAGQRLEEHLKSVDYDVWHCAGCNVHHVLANPSSAARKLKCVQCGHHTVGISRTVLQWPTYTDDGRQRVVQECGHCHWRSEGVVAVPRRVKYVPADDPSRARFADDSDAGHTGSWKGGGGGFGSGGGFSSGGGASGRW
ncbi:MAG: TPM domain-containing protein [Gemmatimonadetes bacterium]|nr:TPM domain-containing protein [Gemmatimonadota bacterium]